MNKSGSGIKIVVVRRKKSSAANPDLGRLKTVKDWGAIWLEEGTVTWRFLGVVKFRLVIFVPVDNNNCWSGGYCQSAGRGMRPHQVVDI